MESVFFLVFGCYLIKNKDTKTRHLKKSSNNAPNDMLVSLLTHILLLVLLSFSHNKQWSFRGVRKRFLKVMSLMKR